MEFPGKIQAVQYIRRGKGATSSKGREARGGVARGGVGMLCANCGRELEERSGAAKLVQPGAETPAADSLHRRDGGEADR